MTRERAKEIGLYFINKYIKEFGEGAIYLRAPKTGKSSWTALEYKEAVEQDKELLENSNPIDDILNLEKYYQEHGKSLEDEEEIKKIK